MGRTAHFQARVDPFDLTFGLTLEKWKGRASPSSCPRSGNRCTVPRPGCAGGIPQRVPVAARPGAAREACEPVAHRRDRSRPAYRGDALRAELAPGAQTRVEREARHDLHRPDGARPLLPDRDRRAGRGATERDDLAGQSRAQGLRRPGPVRRPAQQARAAGGRGRDRACERPDPRRRELVRHAPHRDRLEAAVLPPRVAGAIGAHRQPRLDGTLRDGEAGPDGHRALPQRPAPTPA